LERCSREILDTQIDPREVILLHHVAPSFDGEEGSRVPQTPVMLWFSEVTQSAVYHPLALNLASGRSPVLNTGDLPEARFKAKG
jgi:hypothetical protein